MKRITDRNFFKTDTVSLAKNLIGKWIITDINGVKKSAQISETEAYLGINDSACHTYRGRRTSRTEPMWQEGGTIYIYLCYGMHYLFNIVSRDIDEPEAVLIRAVVGANGPAKLTKLLGIDKSLNGENITTSKNIGIYDDGEHYNYKTDTRVGINFASLSDQSAKLRFVLDD